MDKSAYSYAFIKTLYDRGDDYIDSFWPLVLEVLPRPTQSTIEEIQDKINKQFNLKIELFLLKTIIGRARKKNYVEFKLGVRPLYSISNKGSEYLQGLEAQDDVQRRINALTEDIRQYFDDHGSEITSERAVQLLTNFVANNLETLVGFLNPSAQPTIFARSTVPVAKSDEINLIEYLEQAKLNKPDEYRTLQEMVYGSIISALLFVKDSNELTQLQETPFRNCEVFIDTNILFSLLGFHSDQLNEATTNLLEQMKQSGFRLKVFDFTLDELSRVVGGYARVSDIYPSDLKIDSVYSVMKRRGWAITDVNDFLMNIEEIIGRFGIMIERCPDVDLLHYEPESEGLKDALLSYKPQSGKSSINHDIAAIEQIRKKRRRSVRFVEDAKVFFLSANTALQNFDLSEFGHKDNNTIGEVILDRLLANLLWLKHPDTPLPLETIIAAHSRDLMIDRQIWVKFYKVLEKLKHDNRVTKDQLATLFYHNRIRDILRVFSTNELDEITDEFVLDEIEKASSEIKQKHEEIIGANAELVDKLFSAKSANNEARQAKERAEENSAEEIRRVSKSLRASAAKSSKRRSYALLVVCIVLMLVIEYMGCLWVKGMLPAEAIQRLRIVFGSDFAVGLATIYLLQKARAPFDKWYVERLYGSKLKEAGLKDKSITLTE